jgi:hypothetical protein
MRRLALILAIAAAMLVPATAQAHVHAITLYDGTGGGGSLCGGINAQDPTLSSLGGCGNWDNRASSVTPNLISTECVILFTGTSYTGSAWATNSNGNQNLPSNLNNAASSLRFGTWTFIPAIGQYGCTSPYS